MNKLLNRIDKIKVLDNYRLRVEMSDGRIGVFNALPYLNKGFFAELKKREYFAQVKIIHNGTGIEWERGQDLSADTISYNLQLLPDENDAIADFSPKMNDRLVQDNPLMLNTFLPKKRTY